MDSDLEIWGLWAAIGLLGLDLYLRNRLLRGLWRELLRGFTLLDLACARLVQRCVRPRYVLRGRCQKRGLCCQNIVAQPPRLIRRRPRLLQLFAHFHRVMHNFHVVARTDDGGLIFSCGHLKTDGRCGIYRYRPRICRDYPVLPFFGPPQLLPGCGYRVAPRVVAAMRAPASLAIVNPHTAVHHPGPPAGRGAAHELPEDFHPVAAPPPAVAPPA